MELVLATIAFGTALSLFTNYAFQIDEEKEPTYTAKIYKE